MHLVLGVRNGFWLRRFVRILREVHLVLSVRRFLVALVFCGGFGFRFAFWLGTPARCPFTVFFLGEGFPRIDYPGSSKSWKFHVKSGDYQFCEGLSEKTQSFQTPGF